MTSDRRALLREFDEIIECLKSTRLDEQVPVLSFRQKDEPVVVEEQK